MSNNSQKAAEENEMAKRFERSETILHWANAVPFLILFITGALNILSHFVIMSPAFLLALRIIHKIVGPLWLLCIGFSFFFIGRELNLSNTRDQIGMGLSDVKWMIMALRSAYNPHVMTPPAGKFNTGQKINTNLVILYVVAFSVSGALMLFFNTMLYPWFVHASLFFMALASVGGHLYLSLLHPSTRPGLIGIFNGMVPNTYIQHHHSLTIDDAVHDAHEEQETTKPGYRVFMTVEIVILILVLIGGGFGVKALGKLHRLNRVERGFNAIVNPGELSKAHGVKEIDACKKCHEYSGELPDKKCLSCHKIIQARREASLGYHGSNNDKKCIRCHKEHPYDRGNSTGSIIKFDKEKFDHVVAAFKLEGKHKDVKCEKCHKRTISEDGNNPTGYFVGLRYDTCLGCHKDFHKDSQGSLGEKCETCHVVAGWQGKNLKFDHGAAKFRLEGKHASVQCEKCHKPQTPGAVLGDAVFRGLKFGRCDDCHKDPHRGELRAGCASCHSSPQGWQGKNLKFEHGRDAKYALVGKHEPVKCVKCHKTKTKNGSLDVTSFRIKHEFCNDCHKDPHRGELRARCASCHSSPKGWKGKNLKFDHNRDSQFPLQGKHKALPCSKCHKTQSEGAPLVTTWFKIKHESCSNCHKTPHKGIFTRSATCDHCHDFASWKKKKR